MNAFCEQACEPRDLMRGGLSQSKLKRDDNIYISVCKNVILKNLKNGTNEPTIRVSRGKYGKPKRCNIFRYGNIVIHGDMKQKPMPWGARVWVEIVTP